MAGRIARVVVTLDATADNRTSIDAGAHLAAAAHAPLHGVFVEDQELFDLAGLPFARQVTIGTGAGPIKSETIALHMKAQADRARRELYAAATRYRLTCSFEITRDLSEPAAQEHDFVIAAGQSLPVAGAFRVERNWLAVHAAARPVLVARMAGDPRGSVVVLLRDRGDASARLLEAAAEIARARNRPLHVMWSAGAAGLDGLSEWIADQASAQDLRPHIAAAPDAPRGLEERLRELDCRLLALEAGAVETFGDSVGRMAEHFASDILVVP